MESSSSDDEDFQLPFWNNWLPPSSQPLEEYKSTRDKKTTNKFVFNISTITPFVKPSMCGNWVPPVNFLNPIVKRKTKVVDKNVYDREPESKLSRRTVENFGPLTLQDCHDSTKINIYSVFGRKLQLYDISKFNDGDLIWGIVNLGIFVHFNLWVNEHGIISGSADGRISKLGCSDTIFISVTNVELMRKILGLSSAQWASLCETIQENKANLKFDALENFTLENKSALEKLWFFICKRRHFLSDQYMLVKFCGAVKCMKNFKIIPKVVVQEIKSTSEHLI